MASIDPLNIQLSRTTCKWMVGNLHRLLRMAKSEYVYFIPPNKFVTFNNLISNLKVRWADIEQKREQDKQRAIGFIVGQTNWKNLIDEPQDHTQALTAIKYIEKIRKK